MKITDTTALNVLCRHSDRGANESDFFHSKVYTIKDAVQRLRQKGYRIQQRGELYFIDLEQVKSQAKARRNNGRTS
jgi:two-component SAPR family response regulator